MTSPGRCIALFAAVLSCAGCWVRSVHPLHSPDSLATDDRILGTWVAPDEKTSFTQPTDTFLVRRSGRLAYALVYVTNGAPASFEVHLTRLADALFADVVPRPPDEAHGPWRLHLLPLHSFVRLSPTQDTMEVVPLDHEWLGVQLAGPRPALAFTRLDDLLLLTAPTADLRRFIVARADDPKAFSHPVVLRRI